MELGRVLPHKKVSGAAHARSREDSLVPIIGTRLKRTEVVRLPAPN